MRIRYPFAGAFIFLLVLSGYIGLLPHGSSIPENLQPNDKFLHLITFFFLSITFYWIADTSRRRALQLTLFVCTLLLGVGSEILQGLLPNDRAFDPFDLLANVVGSLGAIGLCGWYHRRMMERRRKARYGSFAESAPDDVELGVNHAREDHEGGGAGSMGPQESGVMNLEHEVDNWDENAVDNWDSDDGADDAAHGRPGPATAEHDDHNPPPPPYSVHGEGGAPGPGPKERSD